MATYTHEGGSLFHDLISVERSNSDYWYLFDGLGSVTEVVDSNENTQNSYRYEAWGQVKSSSENVTNPYRYVGAYGVHWDSEPGLHFMQARYYAANVGRFITVDPMPGAPQDPASLHRYLYVANNPAVLTDPTGLVAESWISCERKAHEQARKDPCGLIGEAALVLTYEKTWFGMFTNCMIGGSLGGPAGKLCAAVCALLQLWPCAIICGLVGVGVESRYWEWLCGQVVDKLTGCRPWKYWPGQPECPGGHHPPDTPMLGS